MNPSSFIPGHELNRRFYWEVIRLLLDVHFPDLPHAAALIGEGSEVLGFDTAMSMDHDWCPKGRLFLRDEHMELIVPIREMLAQHLPHMFLGFPVDTAPVVDEPGTAVMKMKSTGLVDHRVFPVTLRTFALEWLDWEPDQPLAAADWLSFPSQILRSLTAGAVYYDGVGELTAFRQKLTWYPQDVWLYLMACGWQRISEEEHLMPRAGYVGDELGSAVIGTRLVRDIISLCFLMEKQYAPYPKWFGSAFRQLRCFDTMQPLLWMAVKAATWQEREAGLCQAYEQLAHMHNRLGITQALSEQVSGFYDRPFRIIHGDLFARIICEQIRDQAVQRIAKNGLIGSIDQFSDSTTLRSSVHWRKLIRKLYE